MEERKEGEAVYVRERTICDENLKQESSKIDCLTQW